LVGDAAGDSWAWVVLAVAVLALVSLLLLRRRPRPAAAVPVEEPPVAEPEAEPEAEAEAEAEAPQGTIKGNAATMLFHTTESPFYGRTRADVWFVTEDEARAAGYTRWDES